MTIIWFLRYGEQQTEFLSFWTVFCSFTPRKDPENNNFEKMEKKKKKKIPEDIIILQMCTEKWSATDRMFCHLGPFFSLLPR